MADPRIERQGAAHAPVVLIRVAQQHILHAYLLVTVCIDDIVTRLEDIVVDDVAHPFRVGVRQIGVLMIA